MKRSEQFNELAAALAKAQSEFLSIGKSKTVKFGATQYKYADLSEMIKATTPALSKHGLSITQELHPSEDDENELILETTLMHSSGQWRSSFYPIIRCTKPQEQGSQITYARKYALQGVLNIAADEDDDGQIAATAPAAPSAPEDDFWGPGGAPPTEMETAAPKEGYKDRPLCCGKKMNISKFPNKVTGKIDYYCFTCKRNQPITS